jgi:hypothetical protein
VAQNGPKTQRELPAPVHGRYTYTWRYTTGNLKTNMEKYLEGKKGVAYKLSSSYYYDDFIKRFLHMVFYGFHDFITLCLSENIKIL